MRAILLLLLGVGLGILGAIVAAARWHLGSLTIPVGLVVVLAALPPIARAAAWWVTSRLGALAVGGGWLVATLVLGSTSPSGDVLLVNNWQSIAYLSGGSLILAACASLPLLERAQPSRAVRPDPGMPPTIGE